MSFACPLSRDFFLSFWVLSVATGDADCTESPSRIPDWVLPHEDTHMLFEAGHGTILDLIYARGVPDTPSPDPASFDIKQCTLIIVEIGFCKDLGCDNKFDKNTEKYFPFVATLKR
jgi:hypothetical protein